LHDFKQRLRDLNVDMGRMGITEKYDTDFESSPSEKGEYCYNNYDCRQQDIEKKNNAKNMSKKENVLE
jgi:hypothetical protein